MNHRNFRRASYLLIVCLLAIALRPAMAADVPGNVYNVKAYGAMGDGKALDTDAINKAIDAASSAGGGTVLLPAGNYLTYSIHLKSNITLYIDQGATILAAYTPMDANGTPTGNIGYDAPEPNPETDRYEDFGHSHWHNSLMWGDAVENVTIAGPGKIYGLGLSWGVVAQPPIPGRTDRSRAPRGGRGAATAPARAGAAGAGAGGGARRGGGRSYAEVKAAATQQYPGVADTLPAGIGNKAIALKNSRNITMRDVSILHGGHFAILVTGVDNLTIDNLKIDTPRDGMDIDCCRNVRISNCSVNSPWDDAIVLKSCYGLGKVQATENVTITSCFVSGGYQEGTLLDATYKKFGADQYAGHTGRIKFGTESNGGFKNIAISNCIFDDCQGLALEIVDGGTLEDVSISNITMRDIVSLPIFIRLGDRARGPNSPPPGIIRRVNISDIVARNGTSRNACIISGIPGHEIEDLKISNVQILYPGGGTKEDAALEPAELEASYPEPGMFGMMPAYGFFIRHVKGLELNNVELKYASDEARPPFVINNVKNADFNNIKAPHAADVPTFVLKNVEDFNTHQVRGLADMHKDKVDSEKF